MPVASHRHAQDALVCWLDDVSSEDTPKVGGKNSSLGEMTRTLGGQGIRVPRGFATTADAFRRFLAENGLDRTILEHIRAMHEERASLSETGAAIRKAILGGRFSDSLSGAIQSMYDALSERTGRDDLDVAVRSSATAEDLPDASFAGQQESFLNVRGHAALLDACRRAYASLYTDRAIAYREARGFEHTKVALSVGVQEMVRSDLGSAGVIFTLDTDTGFPRLVQISAAWGLGENVVQGTIEPDQVRVFKPFLATENDPVVEKICGSKEKKRVYGSGLDKTTVDVDTTPEERSAFVLSDTEIAQLARWAVAIEDHYGRPMDIEWAKDGRSGEIFIVQARPETVHARSGRGKIESFRLAEKPHGDAIVTGLAIGRAIASGPVQVVHDLGKIDHFEPGSVLVTEVTDPDWVPILKRAAAVVTDHGGRTSHAAIVSRELGIPAIVGTGKATTQLEDGREVTVDCSAGEEGSVWDGKLEFESTETDLESLPATRTRILLNSAHPATALVWWRLPVQGIGLARMEYLVNNVIRVHPMALARFDEVEDAEARREIEEITRGYSDKGEYFVDRLSHGIALMAAARYPDPVIVRTSDFKTNEYANLVGGRKFEPDEENPMLGWRGASRYYDEAYREGFALECRALRRVRSEMGFRNVVVMIPFCRTPNEADRVLAVMKEHGLERGKDDLRVWVMAEIPSNIIEAEAFAERFDGFSIGSNDLTQLALGVDRDSEKLRALFDERSPTVKWLIRELIRKAHAMGRTVSICGQAPSDHPDFARFLVEAGIDSISVNPDSVVRVIESVAEAEKSLG